jgi:gluconokinase
MIVVLMGPAGAGKTAVGTALAAALGWPFVDADDLHPAPNVEKMRRGIPLTDEDREPWIRAVARTVEDHVARACGLVLACSALRRRHRDAIRGRRSDGSVRLVYLKGTYEVIDRRLRARVGHFMPESLLRSQFDALEEPRPSESLVVDLAMPVDAIVESIVRGLGIGA